MEPLMQFHEGCANSYSHFVHLKKENQILLSPLISDKKEIFQIEGNLGKLIALLDSWYDFHLKSPYLDCRCLPLVRHEFLHLQANN